MLRTSLTAVCFAAVLALIGTSSAESAGSHRSLAHEGALRGAPLKDCTRVNGRFGYYGNPWCTPAEQRRFDRWMANRRKDR